MQYIHLLNKEFLWYKWKELCTIISTNQCYLQSGNLFLLLVEALTAHTFGPLHFGHERVMNLCSIYKIAARIRPTEPANAGILR